MTETITLKCPTCHNQYPQSAFTECPVCREALTPTSVTQTQIFNGNESQGVQTGRDFHGNIIFNPKPNEPKKTLIYRDMIKPIKIASIRPKAWWPIAIGTINISASLLTIFSSISKLTTPESLTQPGGFPWPLFLMATGGLLVFLGMILLRSKHQALPFGLTIEVSRQGVHRGEIFLTRIVGECSLCNGAVRLVGAGSNTIIQCRHYPDQHRWEFDHAILPDVGEDYQQSQGSCA